MFITEKELCDCFSEYAKSYGWVVYPENGNWDLLLVRNKIQIGVQSKLKPNMKVITQTIPDNYNEEGPHYRAVLISNKNKKSFRHASNKNKKSFRYISNKSFRHASDEFIKLCQYLKILIFVKNSYRNIWLDSDHNKYKIRKFYDNINFKHYRWKTKKLVWVPPYIPNLEAGVRSPKKVSKYKVLVCRLELLEYEKGWICRDDVIKESSKLDMKINPSSILSAYFYNTTELVKNNSRQKKWRLKPDYMIPSMLYPDVFDNI
jgi:hypothetical protein